MKILQEDSIVKLGKHSFMSSKKNGPLSHTYGVYIYMYYIYTHI